MKNWRHALDNTFFTGVVLIDLSKGFDCIIYDLLIAKLHAYDLHFNALAFLKNYLKRRKESVDINIISSFSRTIFLGVSQASILQSWS